MKTTILETVLNVSNLRIAVRLVTPDTSKTALPAVLLVHGRTSSQAAHDADVADQLALSGLVALSLDLPGHGKSEGNRDELTGQLFLDAVVAAYDFLHSQPQVDGSRIIGVGSSFGSYLVMRLCSLRPLQALVLRVPVNYPDKFDNTLVTDNDLIGTDAIAWRSLPRKSNETAAMRALNDFQGKVLIIEAENDKLIPSQNILNLIDATRPQQLQHVVIRNAPHIMYRDPACGIISDSFIQGWISEQVGLLTLS